MTKYTTYREADTLARTLPRVKAGDKIKAMGITCTVDEVHYCDIYVEVGNKAFKEATDEKAYYIFYDVEFTDVNGNYRSWKSSFDGGAIFRK